ncbi:uncharacterized protein LOC110457454 [Mizuhopecten yessoensis]|uniref:Uncharacterized protein n=1 Tax=Mizuhopecten yessoensis TaxID=6573 RepID=A0A210Q8N9_MIZYE|nr:uncharacterized protein LOC110457454 [Mizuhopecten yessoensis]OWF45107.1 hypothetical protein KP79_PYT14576 [Mizuhopecten yessoensis]
MSYENHMENERDVTSSLLDFSDGSKHTDKCTFKKKLSCDWAEAVTGWQNIVPSPQYVPHHVSNVIKKRKSEKLPEWQRSANSDHFADMLGENSKAGVRCVGDDFENFPVPPWKANVEQGTFRYVPNNGFYRTIKFLTFDERREWFTVTKKQPEKVSMSWQNKRFQKELKRQLRREFSNYHHYRQRQSPSVSMHESVETTSENPSARSESRKSNRRIKSTHSQSSTTSQISEPQLRPSESSIKSAPVYSQLQKSTSDLYIENFTHRITALEEELKRDSRIARKNQEEPLATKNNQKPKPYSVKDLAQKQREKDTTPRQAPASKEVMPKESFVIKPVGNRDLKPIEKSVPVAQYSNADGDKAQHVTHQLKYTTMGGNGAVLNFPNFQNRENIAEGELDKTLHSYKVAIETTKQSLFQTLSATKIKRRASGKGFTSPATVGACDNISSNTDNVPDKVGKNGHPRGHGSTTQKEVKPHNKKGHIVGILPEIAGKRLEVPPTGHRWC